MIELKEGDRIKFSGEAVVKELDSDGDLWLYMRPVATPIIFSRGDLTEMQIERIEPPLSVGDRVMWNSFHPDRTGEIIKIHEGKAYVFDESGSRAEVRSYDLTDLERIA